VTASKTETKKIGKADSLLVERLFNKINEAQ